MKTARAPSPSRSMIRQTPTWSTSIATRDDGEYMYFVYGYVRSIDAAAGLPDINMQVGFVKKK